MAARAYNQHWGATGTEKATLDGALACLFHRVSEQLNGMYLQPPRKLLQVVDGDISMLPLNFCDKCSVKLGFCRQVILRYAEISA